MINMSKVVKINPVIEGENNVMQRKVDYLDGSPSVQRYLSRLSPGSHTNALYTIHYFIEFYKENSAKFREFSIDDLIEYQRKADNGERYDVLDLLIDWINSMNLRHTTLKQRYNQIRGLFKACRTELPSEQINYQPDRPEVLSKLTPEKLRGIILKSNTLYRAAILSMFMAGMGRDELILWSNTGYKRLVEDLKGNPEYVIIPQVGRKGQKYQKDYYTILAGDALEAVKQYLGERGREEGAIFVNQWGQPLSKKALYSYWLRQIKQLGYYEGKPSVRVRSGMGPHECRDLFRSQWEKSPSKGSVAEFLMQHEVDPNEYNQAHRDKLWVWKEYRKAMPKLNILSSSEPYGLIDTDEVERLRQELEEAKRGQGDVVQQLEAELRTFRENQQEFIKQEIEKALLLARNK